MLSFSPSHDVAQGLAEAVDWYVERAQIASGRSVLNSHHANGPAVLVSKLEAGPLTLAAS